MSIDGLDFSGPVDPYEGVKKKVEDAVVVSKESTTIGGDADLSTSANIIVETISSTESIQKPSLEDITLWYKNTIANMRAYGVAR